MFREPSEKPNKPHESSTHAVPLSRTRRSRLGRRSRLAWPARSSTSRDSARSETSNCSAAEPEALDNTGLLAVAVAVAVAVAMAVVAAEASPLPWSMLDGLTTAAGLAVAVAVARPLICPITFPRRQGTLYRGAHRHRCVRIGMQCALRARLPRHIRAQRGHLPHLPSCLQQGCRPPPGPCSHCPSSRQTRTACR